MFLCTLIFEFYLRWVIPITSRIPFYFTFVFSQKWPKRALEKILVILTVFHIFVENTESVPPSLKLVFSYLQTVYCLWQKNFFSYTSLIRTFSLYPMRKNFQEKSSDMELCIILDILPCLHYVLHLSFHNGYFNYCRVNRNNNLFFHNSKQLLYFKLMGLR